jgi:uncharacterized protein with NRDE domain
MCLAAFSLRKSARYPFIFAANRDEFHSRATAPAGWWEDHCDIFGGRDLVAGGSWLAVDRRGRLAAVTNFREEIAAEYSRSRGRLVQDFLGGSMSAADYVVALQSTLTEYSPFNLILFDGQELRYASNRALGERLSPGVYALSNTHLGGTWPKVSHAEARLLDCVEAVEPSECLFTMLTDQSLHGDLQEGVDRAAKLRSTIFISDARYGTRCSTIVLLSQDGELKFIERRFAENGILSGESTERFRIGGSSTSR